MVKNAPLKKIEPTTYVNTHTRHKVTHHVEHVPVGGVVEGGAGALAAHEQLLVACLHLQVGLQAFVLEQVSARWCEMG